MLVLVVLQIVFYLNPGPCSVHTSYLKVFESDVASMHGSRLHCVQADDSCRSPLVPAARDEAWPLWGSHRK